MSGRAREWVDLLLDPESFSALASSEAGPVTGFGTVDDRPVCVWAVDAPDLGVAEGRAVLAIMDRALDVGCPVIAMVAGGGARIAEGPTAVATRGEILRRQTLASGVVPQLWLVMGPTSGEAAWSAALADVVVLVEDGARLSVHEPDVIETITGEPIGPEVLGGSSVHRLAADPGDAIEWARALLAHLPSNNLEDPPVLGAPADDDPDESAWSPGAAVRELVDGVLDDDLLEVQEHLAPNVVVGFGHLDGRPVGVVANDRSTLAGHLDGAAAEKAARFVRTCDAFNLPVITFVDTPGFVPDVLEESGGLVRRGAKLSHAYAEATVPLITVVVGRAYGSGYLAMGAKALGADATLAWSDARIAARSPQTTVGALHPEASDAERADLVADYERDVATARRAAEEGLVDAVIEPANTRIEIVRRLAFSRTKRRTLPPKKHGNIPL